MFELEEGRTWIVLSKREGHKFSMSFKLWPEAEDYIKAEPGIYKVYCTDTCEIPLTGLKLQKD